MIDPDLLDEWAAIHEAMAAEMRAVAEHARLKARPAVVPQADYGAINTRQTVEVEVSRGQAPVVETRKDSDPLLFEESTRYPYSVNTNPEAVLKTAKIDYERGQTVFIENEAGEWLEYGVDI